MSTTRADSPFTLPLRSFQNPSQADTYRDADIVIDTDSITEYPEYDERMGLNLGAESPASILKPAIDEGAGVEKGSEDEWRKAGIAVHTDVPMRRRSWRSASFSKKRKVRRALVTDAIDRDCGICFGVAVVPCRMVCCGNVFCLHHISDWLYGSSSDGRCPSCRTLCSFVQEVPAAHPADGKLMDYARTHTHSESERALVLLLLQPPESNPPSMIMNSSAPSDPADPYHSSSRTDSQKPPATAIRTGTAADSGPHFHGLGLSRCCFELDSTPAVLVGRMIGRVLSIVGLTLVLFVLLT